MSYDVVNGKTSDLLGHDGTTQQANAAYSHNHGTVRQIKVSNLQPEPNSVILNTRSCVFRVLSVTSFKQDSDDASEYSTGSCTDNGTRITKYTSSDHEHNGTHRTDDKFNAIEEWILVELVFWYFWLNWCWAGRLR